MEKDCKMSEALDIIESLLSIISWLGGDAYEMEAIEKDVNIAGDFLSIHRPIEPSEIVTKRHWEPIPDGIYCLKSDPSSTVTAINKSSAAKKLRAAKKDVFCIKEHGKEQKK